MNSSLFADLSRSRFHEKRANIFRFCFFRVCGEPLPPESIRLRGCRNISAILPDGQGVGGAGIGREPVANVVELHGSIYSFVAEVCAEMDTLQVEIFLDSNSSSTQRGFEPTYLGHCCIFWQMPELFGG